MESRICSTTKYIITIEKEIVTSTAEENIPLPLGAPKKVEKPQGLMICDYIRRLCNSCNGRQPKKDVEVQVQVHVQNEYVEGEMRAEPVEESKIFRKCQKPKAKSEDYYVYYFK